MKNPFHIKLYILLFFLSFFFLQDTLSQDVATIHYHRCGGDYGDYTSDDFNDFWGLHVWDDALNFTAWPNPLKPITSDAFGVVFEVQMQNLAEGLNFIVHQGDSKDLDNDQYLDFAVSGQEVWIVSGDDDISNDFTFYSSYGEAINSSKYCGGNSAVIHYHRCDDDYGDYSSSDFNDFWGLHVWDDALNFTEWTAPLKPLGQDQFGYVFEIPVSTNAQGLNFIMHRGDTKDLDNDQYLDFVDSGQEVWIVSGDDAVSNDFTFYPSFGEATFSTEYCGPPRIATIHYLRCDDDYGDYSSSDFNDFWGVHVWGDVVTNTIWTEPIKATEVNEMGAVFEVPLINGASDLNFIIHRGDTKDPGPDEYLDIINTGDEIWLISGDLEEEKHIQHTSITNAINSPGYCGLLSVATIHYHRCEGDYGNYLSFDYNNYWGLHLWDGALYPTNWVEPMKPTSFDAFGQVFEIPVVEMASNLNFIIHRGDLKDPGADESLDLVNTGNEIWLVSGDNNAGIHTQYTSLNAASFSSFFCGNPIPTISEWGMIILGAIFLIFGITAIKRFNFYPQ